jgi:hypothetical protein
MMANHHITNFLPNKPFWTATSPETNKTVKANTCIAIAQGHPDKSAG